MRVLGILLFEFLLGYILQAFTLILGLYAFNKERIDIKKYLAASIVMMTIIYLVRFIPVNNGIHTLLIIIAALLIGILYLKLSVRFTSRGVVMLTVMIFLIEFIYSYAIISLIGQGKFAGLMNDSLYKYLLGFPTSLLFTALISAYYFHIVKKHSVSIDSYVKKRCGDEDS
jgi:hypothetical protein